MNFNEAVAVVMQNEIDNQSDQYKEAVRTLKYYENNVLDLEDYETDQLFDALRLVNVKELITSTEERLSTTRTETTYITLYKDRSELLNAYDEVLHEDMIEYLDSQHVPERRPFVVIDRTGMDFNDSVILNLNEISHQDDLLAHVDSKYILKG